MVLSLFTDQLTTAPVSTPHAGTSQLSVRKGTRLLCLHFSCGEFLFQPGETELILKKCLKKESYGISFREPSFPTIFTPSQRNFKAQG